MTTDPPTAVFLGAAAKAKAKRRLASATKPDPVWPPVLKAMAACGRLQPKIAAVLQSTDVSLSKAQLLATDDSSVTRKAYDDSLLALTAAGQDVGDTFLWTIPLFESLSAVGIVVWDQPEFSLDDILAATANVSTATPSNTSYLLASRASTKLIRDAVQETVQKLSDVCVHPVADALGLGSLASSLLRKASGECGPADEDIPEEGDDPAGPAKGLGLKRAELALNAGRLLSKKIPALDDVFQTEFFSQLASDMEDQFMTLQTALAAGAADAAAMQAAAIPGCLELCEYLVLRLVNTEPAPLLGNVEAWQFTYKTSVLTRSVLAALHHVDPDYTASDTLYVPAKCHGIDISVASFVPLLKALFPAWKVATSAKNGKTTGLDPWIPLDVTLANPDLIGIFEKALNLAKGYVNRPIQFFKLFGTTEEETGNLIGRNAFDLVNIWEALDTRQKHTADISDPRKLTGKLRFQPGDTLITLVSVKRERSASQCHADDDGEDLGFTMAYEVNIESSELEAGQDPGSGSGSGFVIGDSTALQHTDAPKDPAATVPSTKTPATK